MSNDLDFDAWEAPPPPDGLAEAVVARMAATAAMAEPAGAAPTEAGPAPRRRWVIAASAAAALVAAGGIWALVRHREPAAAQNGAVIADRARHVELPGASADLDRGAEIHWHRTGDGLDIEQRGGIAVWRVPADERIVIGASVASIEATGEASGASLRVEVPMNMPTNKIDARVIGASAAVALLTVVVYEGSVKVAHSGQTVIVQPGTTYTIPAPSKTPDLVGASVVPDEPAAADVEKLLAANNARLAACVGKDGGEPTLIITIDTDGTVSSDEVDRDESPDDAASCMMTVLDALTFPASLHGGKYAYTVKRPKACDVDKLTTTALGLEQADQHMVALDTFEQAIRCRPSTRLYQLAFMASCNLKSVSKAQYYWKRIPAPSRASLEQMCMRNGITPQTLEDLDDHAIDAASGKGQVRIDCIPQARVLFDGIDSGTTPVLIKTAPGKHKVTYVIDENRYTYPVVVKAGYTETLSKQLQ